MSNGVRSQRDAGANRADVVHDQIVVLFLAADPFEERLNLDTEIREISKRIRGSDHRDRIRLVSAWAVSPSDLQELLLAHEPHIVHFSGHGLDTEELVLKEDGEPKTVDKQTIVNLVEAVDGRVKVILLNACHSKPLAAALADVVGCAIGMNTTITDGAAIAFAGSFYQSIGFGKSVLRSFELGRNAIELKDIPEEKTPELFAGPGVDPDKVVLIAPEQEERDRQTKLGEQGQKRGWAQNWFWSWQGWGVVAAVCVTLAALSAFVLDIADLRSRLWPAGPKVSMSFVEPGPEMIFDPATRTLTFKILLQAENTGGAIENLNTFEAVVESNAPKLYFPNSDFRCERSGQAYHYVQVGPPERFLCEASHTFAPEGLEAWKIGGTRRLSVEIVGRAKKYPILICWDGSDDFWKTFLSSSTVASRRNLDPSDCPRSGG